MCFLRTSFPPSVPPITFCSRPIPPGPCFQRSPFLSPAPERVCFLFKRCVGPTLVFPFFFPAVLLVELPPPPISVSRRCVQPQRPTQQLPLFLCTLGTVRDDPSPCFADLRLLSPSSRFFSKQFPLSRKQRRCSRPASMLYSLLMVTARCVLFLSKFPARSSFDVQLHRREI